MTREWDWGVYLRLHPEICHACPVFKFNQRWWMQNSSGARHCCPPERLMAAKMLGGRCELQYVDGKTRFEFVRLAE